MQKWRPNSERAQEEEEGEAPAQAGLLLLRVQIMEQDRKEAGVISGVMVPLPVPAGASAPAPADLLPATVVPLDSATAPGLVPVQDRVPVLVQVQDRVQDSVQGLLELRLEIVTPATAWKTVDAMAVPSKTDGTRINIVIIIYYV